ncbi:MAG: MotA/TolQ/ExbB proton channel family protein [Desulfobacterales bacterium]|nr:MotA/TolQ/ExbB proton channel family protein [Desulfobacterales bacterium]MDD4073021.1 MotA/TolQ/ExbB proton channel family protein [Desulfobacterales bacterium]MDD4392013.1 MotA/TolQ/ExbB proton channel family protein [Desulfobacterales bacterium]
MKKYLKADSDPKALRQQIQATLFDTTQWAERAFKSFRVSWEDSRISGEDTASIPIRLREFLTPEIVLDSVRNRRMTEALPGIFVAIGIFGTFLGLMLGLNDLRLDELENLKQGVGHLVSGLSLAFQTSLLGIFLSILFTLSCRFAVNGLEQTLLRVDDLVYNIFPCHSNERYARKYMELQADIKHGLQTMATDIAIKLSDTFAPALGEVMETQLVPVIKDLHEWIKSDLKESKQQQSQILDGFNEKLTRMSDVITDHFEHSQQKQSEAMETVLKEYVAYMNDTFKMQFQKMGRIIEDTTKAQTGIREQLLEFTNQLKSQFSAQTELIEKTGRAGEILSESLDGLEGISQKLKSSSGDIASAAALLESSATRAKEGQGILQESMQSQVQAMDRARKESEGAWNTITENSAAVVEQIRGTIRELAEGIGTHLNKALETYDEKVAEVVERFSGSLFEVKQSMEEMPGLVVSLEGVLKTISQDISTQKEILDDLRHATNDVVVSNIEKASEASVRMANVVETISGISEDFQRGMDTLVEGFKTGSEMIQMHNKECMDQLKRLSNEMSIELRQQSAMLEKNSPVHNAIIELNQAVEKYSAPNPEQQMNPELMTTLNGLCSHVERINNFISRDSGNGNGNYSEAVLERMSSIDRQINTLHSGMSDNILPHLKTISSSMDKITDSLQPMKITNGPESSPAENRGGFFRRMMSK